jgi:hypothetical protein
MSIEIGAGATIDGIQIDVDQPTTYFEQGVPGPGRG